MLTISVAVLLAVIVVLRLHRWTQTKSRLDEKLTVERERLRLQWGTHDVRSRTCRGYGRTGVPVLRWPGLSRAMPGRAGGPGDLCTVCRKITDSQQPPTAERAVTAAEAAETNGILARLRRT
ncbi:hypothetical protein OG612_00535 [Streptomyces sp. NBC_01527]|uniref:hypothetical protein n=1 Tax=Streptomyces sp. NBC_01527 TaxID=2903894 RepID=UPI00386FC2A4